LTPEAKVKKKVVDVIKKNGAYYFFPATGGYGRSGVPDVVCCYRGYFVAIECKAGTNKPTPLQEAEMAKIREAQGFTLVVNENNIDDVQKRFTIIDKGLMP
jgi:Holliday junction resolvase